MMYKIRRLIILLLLMVSAIGQQAGAEQFRQPINYRDMELSIFTDFRLLGYAKQIIAYDRQFLEGLQKDNNIRYNHPEDYIYPVIAISYDVICLNNEDCSAGKDGIRITYDDGLTVENLVSEFTFGKKSSVKILAMYPNTIDNSINDKVTGSDLSIPLIPLTNLFFPNFFGTPNSQLDKTTISIPLNRERRYTEQVFIPFMKGDNECGWICMKSAGMRYDGLHTGIVVLQLPATGVNRLTCNSKFYVEMEKRKKCICSGKNFCLPINSAGGKTEVVYPYQNRILPGDRKPMDTPVSVYVGKNISISGELVQDTESKPAILNLSDGKRYFIYGNILKQQICDRDGNFSINGLPSDNYKMIVLASGYKPLETVIRPPLNSNGETQQPIILQPLKNSKQCKTTSKDSIKPAK